MLDHYDVHNSLSHSDATMLPQLNRPFVIAIVKNEHSAQEGNSRSKDANEAPTLVASGGSYVIGDPALDASFRKAYTERGFA
jgi:hypothetical protein